MSTSTVGVGNAGPRLRLYDVRRVVVRATLLLGLASLAGCGQVRPPASVEGTLCLSGEPLDNCLITFLPEPNAGEPQPHAASVTNERGYYRLHLVDQREGASVGLHRVTVQDLSVSTGVRRQDHGTVDLASDQSVRIPVRHSRVPARYGSPAETPLRKDVQLGWQRIDFDIR